MARQSLLECRVCRAQPALAGAKVKMEHGSCVSHGKLLEVHHDQNLAMLLVELGQDGVKCSVGLASLGLVNRCLRGVGDRQDLGEPLYPMHLAELGAAMVLGHA